MESVVDGVIVMGVEPTAVEGNDVDLASIVTVPLGALGGAV